MKLLSPALSTIRPVFALAETPPQRIPASRAASR
jgi:hypothetical protein